MRHLIGILLALLCFNSSSVFAQGKVTWATNYPQAGTVVGKIAVKGTVTLATNWKIVNSEAYAYTWEKGSGKKVPSASIVLGGSSSPYTFDVEVGRTTGVVYNIVIEVTYEFTDSSRVIITSDAAQAKAK